MVIVVDMARYFSIVTVKNKHILFLHDHKEALFYEYYADLKFDELTC